MKVKDVMRKEFLFFQGDDKLDHIVKTLVEKGITSAPVFEAGEFIGIVDSSTIVNSLTPKKYAFLWKKREETPINDLKKIIASKLVKKSRVKLNSEQNLSKVLKLIVKEKDCIPVIDKNRLVGIVRNEDMTKFILKEFAKNNYEEELKEAKEEVGQEMNTELDTLLKLINEKGAISANEVSKNLGISVKSAEKMGECLHNHHLIEMKYSFFKGAEFRRKEHEKV